MFASDALRQTAWRQHQAGDLVRAEQAYQELLERGIQGGSIDERDAINLGGLLRQQGRLGDAQRHYETCMPLLPTSESLRLNAINALIESGECQKAIAICTDAIDRIGPSRDLVNAKGRILMRAGQVEEALTCFEQLLQEGTSEIEILLNSGMALDALQRWPEALEQFKKATKLAADDPRPFCNCLILMGRLGRFNEAEQLHDKLNVHLKQAATVRMAFANLLMNQGDYSTAERHFGQLCIDEPNNASHWLNQAACLKALKHNIRCTEVLKEGLKWQPLHDDLMHAYGQSLAEMGRYSAAMQWLIKSTEGQKQLSTNYLCNLQFIGAGYGLISSKERQQMSRSWEMLSQKQGVGPLWADQIQPSLGKRRLRVGYLSADLNRHPVGRFLLPILKGHDQNIVEVFGLSTTQEHDQTTDELQQHCDRWLDLKHKSSFDVARQIADLQLDILVELGGFTAQSPIEVLVHRPSPVQLSYLGYCGPTYLKTIDGWIGDDKLFEGLNAIDRSAHALINIEGGYMAYSPSRQPPLKEPEQGRPFRFGSFNHSRKLTNASIDLFCSVLKACPEAELLLKSISFVEKAERQRTRKRFIAAGLDPNRLVIQPWVEGWENHMECYHGMDVALDPLPYSGATTTCEALSMGVPVISLAGKSMASRLSISILASLERPEWIAHSTTDYITIAKKLYATTTPRSLQQRFEVRQQLIDSPLGDGKRVSQQLERHFLAITEKNSNHRAFARRT
tara:strand:+ start:941 stop:3148 length:2208 start_codon:yes stop_codon:yes gene_type:complete